ncbi:hypothetical protein D3C71_1839740 [compost metagenome]
MLHAALTFGEDFQLALRTVDQLFVGAVCPLQRNLRILFTVGDEERHLDAIQDAVQMNILGDGHELISVFRAPYPGHMRPVMRHRKTAFLFQATLLYITPVMVGTPHHAASEARLKGDRARAVIAAQ